MFFNLTDTTILFYLAENHKKHCGNVQKKVSLIIMRIFNRSLGISLIWLHHTVILVVVDHHQNLGGADKRGISHHVANVQ